MKKILIGNSFPMNLIRREVRIEPRTLEELKTATKDAEIDSYWGHSNTLDAVSVFVGLDLSPEIERPAVTLAENGFPKFNGHVFEECWVISPEYRNGYRPELNKEVSPGNIKDWCILHIEWSQASPSSRHTE